MMPQKEGQIVRFHNPYPDEDPNQLYVIKEIHFDVDKPRAHIKALGTGLSFPPTSVVLIDDLEVIDVSTSDLIGHRVSIRKSDYSEATGIVKSVREQKINLNLSIGINGVETNVWLTIVDNTGVEHTGTLFVS